MFFFQTIPTVVWINPCFTEGKWESGSRKIAEEDKSSARTEIAYIDVSRLWNCMSRDCLSHI